MSTPVTYQEILAQVRFHTLPVRGADGQDVWVAEIVDGKGAFAFPTTQGDPGDRGPAGPAATILGKKASSTQLPVLTDTAADRGKAYWVGGVLWAWSGTAWVDSNDLTGPAGSAAAIAAAPDYDGTVAPVAGSSLRHNGSKWFAQDPIANAWERTSDMTGTPVANALGTSSGTVPTDTAVAIPWQSEAGYPGFNWSSTSNPSRIYITRTGKYAITATLGWEQANNNSRGIGLRVNGSSASALNYAGGHVAAANTGAAGDFYNITNVASWRLIPLSAGNYIELLAWQNNGTNVDVVARAHGTRITVEYQGA